MKNNAKRTSLFVVGGLSTVNQESEHFIMRYSLPLSFYDFDKEWRGDVFLYFDVSGFGQEDNDGSVHTSFHVPCFMDANGNYLGEIDALMIVFSENGKKIQDLADRVNEGIWKAHSTGNIKELVLEE